MSGNNNSSGGCLIPMVLVGGGILYLAIENPLWLIPIVLVVVLFFVWLFKK